MKGLLKFRSSFLLAGGNCTVFFTQTLINRCEDGVFWGNSGFSAPQHFQHSSSKVFPFQRIVFFSPFRNLHFFPSNLCFSTFAPTFFLHTLLFSFPGHCVCFPFYPHFLPRHVGLFFSSSCNFSLTFHVFHTTCYGVVVFVELQVRISGDEAISSRAGFCCKSSSKKATKKALFHSHTCSRSFTQTFSFLFLLLFYFFFSSVKPLTWAELHNFLFSSHTLTHGFHSLSPFLLFVVEFCHLVPVIWSLCMKKITKRSRNDQIAHLRANFTFTHSSSDDRISRNEQMSSQWANHEWANQREREQRALTQQPIRQWASNNRVRLR